MPPSETTLKHLEDRIKALETAKIPTKRLQMNELRKALAAQPQNPSDLLLPHSIGRDLLKETIGMRQLTALPASGNTVGDQYILKHASAGYFWHVYYSGETTFPWLVLGGTPMDNVQAGGPITGTGFSLCTLVVPFKGEWRFNYGSGRCNQTSNVLTELSCAILLNGVTQDSAAVISPSVFVGGSVYVTHITAQAQFAQYQIQFTANNGGAWSIGSQYMSIMPNRLA